MDELIAAIRGASPGETQSQVLELLEHHFTEGLLGAIYNGHSNVDLSAELIIFDVQAIFTDETDATGRAALNIIMNTINNQLITNYRHNAAQRRRIVITIDEAHLLLDRDNPETLKFLVRTVKRIRKYNGALILTTQNPGDFADGAAGKGLTNILANIQYALFLALKPQDVAAVDQLYRASGGLTAYEQKHLTSLPVGACLFNPAPTYRKFIRLHYNPLEQTIA